MGGGGCEGEGQIRPLAAAGFGSGRPSRRSAAALAAAFAAAGMPGRKEGTQWPSVRPPASSGVVTA
jgi:hypothetical protein